MLIAEMLNTEVVSYNHIKPTKVFSVKTQYKYIGRMKPRQFQSEQFQRHESQTNPHEQLRLEAA